MKRSIQIVGVILVLGGLTAWLALRGSLPLLSGEVDGEGLVDVVVIDRDALGVATVRGRNRQDVAWATGFLHAQDRFFQMDLMRRATTGELSELFGARALNIDRERRVHRMRARAKQVWKTLTGPEQELLRAYTRGVNAGLDKLFVRPFEYLLLRARPEPWQEEDSLLVTYAFFFELTDHEVYRDRTFAPLKDGLPAELHEFVTATGTEWDAPMVGGPIDVPPVPGRNVCDLQEAGIAASATAARDRPIVDEQPMAGSNGWAVAGSRSASGKAILANDMHLNLRVPNIWYRLRLVVEDAGAASMDLTGVTAPGAPFVVAGSNGSVAWGFTNSYGDWSDLVLLELKPGDPTRYRTPDGYRQFTEQVEEIRVKGRAPVRETIRETLWGPVVGTDHRGRPQALRWLAHEPQAVNLRIWEFERASDLREIVRIAHTVGSPPQNLMVADHRGEIAWTIMGRIPIRQGYDPRLPSFWHQPGTGWSGWLPTADYPVVMNPEMGFIWTANARVVDGEMLEHIGNGGYVLGARAGQIRDGLARLPRATIDDMLAIQLDDRSILHERWRDLLVGALSKKVNEPAYAELMKIVADWNGYAHVDSVGYRVVRAFRLALRDRIFSDVITGCGDVDGGVQLRKHFQTEGPLWRLVTEQPAHLLPRVYASWDELFDSAILAALLSCDGGVETCTWGAENHVRISHPLARSLPLLGAWLNINDGPLPGGDYTPRLQQGAHAASERFAVSPGDEANGYFHMPGGQSGHPLSPFFRAGHDAWVNGNPLPFLPGERMFQVTLQPTAPGR